jgi:hypothetical protein
MSLYEVLASHQRPNSFPKSSEALFFNHYSYMLADNELWARFLKPVDSFDTVRANILLRALLNKQEIEKLYASKSREEKNGEEAMSLKDFMESGMSDFPYLINEGKKIYVPIFPRSLNLIYCGDYDKLGQTPYKQLFSDYEAAMIDPFDYYGFNIYDSYFTRLVAVRKTPKTMAAYDYDAECLYFINAEGRLDAKIALFDRGIATPVKTHMIKRIERVADAYLAFDREGMMKALVEENLISSSLIHEILGKEIKASSKVTDKDSGR